jgi:hypothetical protein
MQRVFDNTVALINGLRPTHCRNKVCCRQHYERHLSDDIHAWDIRGVKNVYLNTLDLTSNLMHRVEDGVITIQ